MRLFSRDLKQFVLFFCVQKKNDEGSMYADFGCETAPFWGHLQPLAKYNGLEETKSGGVLLGQFVLLTNTGLQISPFDRFGTSEPEYEVTLVQEFANHKRIVCQKVKTA